MAGPDYNIVAIVHSVSPRYAVEASAAQCCPVCRAAAVPGPLGGMDAFTRDGLSTSLAQLDTVFSEVSRCSLVSESQSVNSLWGQERKLPGTGKAVFVWVVGD